MSLSFLHKKSWHTGNTSVQRNVYLAEEQAKAAAKDAKEVRRDRALDEA